MTVNAIALAIVWVAAHHGLRGDFPPICLQDQRRLWPLVHQLTDALGNPPAPGGPS